ncbi:TldD/PmbA family protein [Egicoccus halophilus]|uniref:Peptidase U62 n=1 Tax=Egicoccus halophilus TaxID=1670830 RepID=A0A8J3A9A9_9ACTN|nr:metallopeptidase TldD-related protein [Egicoccus halophilus]GGI05220.1 peptidase U62 [Egicoccus halophilus]
MTTDEHPVRDLTDLQALADRVVELVRTSPRAQHATVEANVLVGRTRHGLTRFANSFVHQHVGEDTVSVALTLAVDGRTATAATTDTRDDALRSLIASTLDSASLQPVDPHWPGATPPAPVTREGNFDAATADARPEERAERVKAFVDADRDLRAAGYLDTEATWAAFASTAGQRVVGRTSRATVDGIHQTGSSAGSAHQTSQRLTELDAAAAGALAADRGRRSAEFVDVDPGIYEVVLGPEAVATILTFLGVYGFNAKMHLEGGSYAKIGEQQLDAQLTILEDPDDPRSVALPFDNEGTPRRTYPLVEAGVTRNLAHDRRTARRAGTQTTGSAVPGGAGFGAVPTTMRLVAGTPPAEQLVADVGRGLLVTQFHYCRVLDPKTLVVTGLTRNGTFLVEDGEVVGAVGNLRFTQSFVQALAQGQVAAIGNDDRYADAEFGPGAVIAPSLRLKAWNFTGGARG